MKPLRVGAGALALTAFGGGIALAAPPAAPARPVRAEAPAPDFRKQARLAVEKSLPLLLKGAAGLRERRNCMACHHQIMTAMAVSDAVQARYRVDAQQQRANNGDIRGQLAALLPLLRAAAADPAQEPRVDFELVDPPVTGGYYLAGYLAAGGSRDEASTLLARHLGRKQLPDGRWASLIARPPSEGSDWTATALVLRALKEFSASEHSAEAAGRIVRGQEWLARNPGRSTEDRAFRLLGLVWSAADPAIVAEARKSLLDEQADDGGWGQLPGMKSDAYATGLALTALARSGMAPTEAPYSRGAVYLVAIQQFDGSWLVKARTVPLQPHVETGFPHGRDQFISSAATAWAAMALMPFAGPPSPTGAAGSAARR